MNDEERLGWKSFGENILHARDMSFTIILNVQVDF
jgi:hypothetical protein